MKKNYRGNRGKILWTSKALGEYMPSNYDMEAVSWCFKNNIHIYIHADEPYVLHLAVRINGKETISPETYSGEIIQKKKYEFYKYYYEKYNV
mgnify:CR=1 FL=1|tara:strand:- start:145 stop:420 length:276 start_codon:yes stop_codon:yes gene_type:complete